MDSELKNRFKKLMSMMESSGGKNTDHREMTSGMHAGSSAQGEFGLMPLTAKEMANRRIAQGKGDKLDKTIAKLSDDEAKIKVPELLNKEPKRYNEYVDGLMDHVLQKQSGDLASAAIAWHDGHNLSPSGVKKLVDSGTRKDYLARVHRLIGKVPSQVDKQVAEKALITTKGVMETNPTESSYVSESPFMQLTEVPQYKDIEPETIRYRKLKKLITPKEGE